MIVVAYDPKRGEGWFEIDGTSLSFHADRLVLKLYGNEILFVDASKGQQEAALGFWAPPDEPQVATLHLVAPATWRTAGFGES